MIRKYLSVVALLAFGATARADTIQESNTTTDSVAVSVGCWNPALCDDPAAYWNALGLNVPLVEPPASDFAPVGEPMLINWTTSPPAWFVDTPLGSDPPAPAAVATPEPASLAFLSMGCLLLLWLRR
jgi:hypothetical protein